MSDLPSYIKVFAPPSSPARRYMMPDGAFDESGDRKRKLEHAIAEGRASSSMAREFRQSLADAITQRLWYRGATIDEVRASFDHCMRGSNGLMFFDEIATMLESKGIRLDVLLNQQGQAVVSRPVSAEHIARCMRYPQIMAYVKERIAELDAEAAEHTTRAFTIPDQVTADGKDPRSSVTARLPAIKR